MTSIEQCIIEKSKVMCKEEIDKAGIGSTLRFMGKIRKSYQQIKFYATTLGTECADERAALANLITNLTLDTEENKTILKQLKKANASLTQEMKECRTNLDETGRAMGEATSCRDSCLIALQNKQNEFEKYKSLNDRTSDYKILQTKLNETLGLLARKDIDIQEGLKTKNLKITVVNQKQVASQKESIN
ncbi:hypothetical protein Tco_0189015 [Tanacetum coccineum]